VTARLYEVTTTVMRDGFKRAMVTTRHVAAPTRQKAISIARERTYTRDSDAVAVSARCLGNAAVTASRTLLERLT
jgi:hypothetical protein